MPIQIKKKDDESETPPDEIVKTNGHNEEQVEETVVEETEDVVDQPVENPEKDEMQKYVDMISELGEGGLRDALYKDGMEIDEVENTITDVHRALKRGVKPSKIGMYASGGADNLVDNSEGLFDMEKDKSEEKETKKKEKKSEYDDPVEEITSILKEGRAVPLKLAEKLLGTKDNFDRLSKVTGVVITKYQIYMKFE